MRFSQSKNGTRKRGRGRRDGRPSTVTKNIIKRTLFGTIRQVYRAVRSVSRTIIVKIYEPHHTTYPL